MGGKKKVNSEEYYNILTQCNIFTPAATLKTLASTSEWEKAAKMLKISIKPQTLYLYVKKNTENILCRLEKNFCEQNNVNKNVESNHNSVFEEEKRESSSPSSDESSEENSLNCENIFVSNAQEEFEKSKKLNPKLKACDIIENQCSLNINIMQDIIETDQPSQKIVLIPNRWTIAMTRALNSTLGIKCPYSFKKGQVYSSSNKWFDFYGWCPECKNYIYGVCPKKPTSNSEKVTLEILTLDTKSIPHIKKRPFFGHERREAKTKLKHMTAYQYRLEMINEKMKFGDFIPTDIPSLEVLRKVKEEAMNNYINLQGPKEPLQSLIYLSTQNDINSTIVVDATGSLMKSLVVHETTSSHIMLYQLLSWFEDEQFNILKNEYAPLDQLVSTKQDTNTVRNWIGNWVHRNKKHPTQTVTDCSLVLLNALSMELNGCSYKEFNIKCLLYLQLEGKYNPQLTSFIRLDRAHFINAICRWKIWKSPKNSTAKDFYTYIFGYALTIKEFKTMEKLILAAFVISQRSKDSIKESINKSKDLTFNVTLEDTMDNDNQHLQKDQMTNYINSLYEKSTKYIDKNTSLSPMPNNFYLPDIKDNMILLFTQFPSFSLVMKSYFSGSSEVASTCRSESYNKDLKENLELRGVISVNKFVLWHSSIIKAQTNLCFASIKEYKNLQKNCSNVQPDKENFSHSDVSEKDNEEENVEIIDEIPNSNENIDSQSFYLINHNYESFKNTVDFSSTICEDKNDSQKINKKVSKAKNNPPKIVQIKKKAKGDTQNIVQIKNKALIRNGSKRNL
ncbi:hypothetical protein TKK_0000198 [Trichogramma kaykai]